jgi:deferrochelatase/peroxidase EfeB
MRLELATERTGASRRTVLRGVLGAALVPWGIASCMAGDDSGPSSHPALRPPKADARLALLTLPVAAPSATRAIVELAARARRLGAGRPTTIGVGLSAFTKLGVRQRPRGMRAMTPFAGDLLEPHRTDADVVVQVEADSTADAEKTLQGLIGGVPGARVTWASAGHRADNRVDDGRALTQNSFGFTEGFGNVDAREHARVDGVALIRDGSGEPPWAVGGSYLALRIIRLAGELWDADTVEHQERIMGRRRDGTWLDGSPATAEPDFTADPQGKVTPLDSHVRRAHPRTPGTSAPPLIRRSWAYTETQTGGAADDGLLFMCYQSNLDAGFVAVQRRLEGQAMDRYLLTVGGGYFFVPPPDADGRRWEEQLLNG